LRQNKELRREIVAEIVEIARDVDTRLTGLQDRVSNLLDDLKAAKVDAAEVRSKLPGWVSTTVIVVTVVLAWTALGQVALLWWGIVHARRRSQDAPAN
jgi:hypothetical protein